jgi:hypothetical protein
MSSDYAPLSTPLLPLPFPFTPRSLSALLLANLRHAGNPDKKIPAPSPTVSSVPRRHIVAPYRRNWHGPSQRTTRNHDSRNANAHLPFFPFLPLFTVQESRAQIFKKELRGFFFYRAVRSIYQ